MAWLVSHDARARRGGAVSMLLATLLLGAASGAELLGDGVLGRGPSALLLACLAVSVAFLILRLRIDAPLAGAVICPLVAAVLCALGLKALGAATATSPVTCPGVGSSSPGPSPSERSSKSSRNESASVAIAAFVVCPLVA